METPKRTMKSVQVDNAAWLRFKGYCATKGYKIGELLMELTENFLEQERKRGNENDMDISNANGTEGYRP